MNTPKRYTKKPVTIEAMQFDGSNESARAIMLWAEPNEPEYTMFLPGNHGDTLPIETLEGVITASSGDYIIKGIQGEFYPCKPDIFAATYEPSEQNA